MTLEEFNELSLDQRCDAIWEWGFFVSRCSTNGLNKVLYSLHGFLAEMSINISDNKIMELSAFSQLDGQLEDLYRLGNDNPFVRATIV